MDNANDNYKEAVNNISDMMLEEAQSYADNNADANDVYLEYNKFFGNTVVISFDVDNINRTFDIVYEDGEDVSSRLFTDIKSWAFEFANIYKDEIADQESNEDYKEDMKSANAQYYSDKI
tara:strand:+ start:219 stop:578 length:360 start_codon:yes stop_codon:yes gene_type:complete